MNLLNSLRPPDLLNNSNSNLLPMLKHYWCRRANGIDMSIVCVYTCVVGKLSLGKESFMSLIRSSTGLVIN